MAEKKLGQSKYVCEEKKRSGQEVESERIKN